jgi:hypothetical protein
VSEAVRTVVRLRHWLLAAAAVTFTTSVYSGTPTDWRHLIRGGHELLGPDGLHIYARLSEIQVGPLGLLAARCLEAIAGDSSATVARIGGAALLGLATMLAERVARPNPDAADESGATAYLGLLVLPAWIEMSLFGHLDDVLAALLTLVAAYLVTVGGSGRAGFALAAAIAAKPWAFGAAPVILATPRRLRALGFLVAAVVTTWAPFVIADRHTLRAGKPTTPVARDSLLHLVGVGLDAPSWVRPAQLALALSLGVLAVALGRWRAAILVMAASRILLDPGTYAYYVAPLALGALIFDLWCTRGRRPVATLAAFVTWLLSKNILAAEPTAAVRTFVLVTLLGWVLTRRLDPSRDGRPSASGLAV